MMLDVYFVYFRYLLSYVLSVIFNTKCLNYNYSPSYIAYTPSYYTQIYHNFHILTSLILTSTVYTSECLFVFYIFINNNLHLFVTSYLDVIYFKND